MKNKIKENLLFVLSLVMLCFSSIAFANSRVQAKNAKAIGNCVNCGGPWDGGECYDTSIGGTNCLFTTSGACRTAGTCS